MQSSTRNTQIGRGGPAAPGFSVNCGGREVPVVFVRHPRARRYILRLTTGGVARVTVPRGGTFAGAREFVREHAGWLERQLQQAARTVGHGPWRPGHRIFFRGQEHALELVPASDGQPALVRFADQTAEAGRWLDDLRVPVQARLWTLAAWELPTLTREFAKREGLVVRRVTVRNQRTRWGSCSAGGSISLNWRLVMMPEFCRDYVIWHELTHLRHPNHSARFWRAVAAVCPECEAARAWIRRHGHQLH